MERKSPGLAEGHGLVLGTAEDRARGGNASGESVKSRYLHQSSTKLLRAASWPTRTESTGAASVSRPPG